MAAPPTVDAATSRRDPRSPGSARSEGASAVDLRHLPSVGALVGALGEFYQYLHQLVARATNALRGRFENLWATEQTSVVRLVEVDDVVEKVVYAATNPVTAGLVTRVH